MLSKKTHDFIYARNTAGLTQTEAGVLLGVSRSQVARWESDKVDIPLFKYKAFMTHTETKPEDIPSQMLGKYREDGYPEGFNPEDYDDYDLEEEALKELEGDRYDEKARIRYLLTVRRVSSDKSFVDSEMKAYDESQVELVGIGYEPPAGRNRTLDEIAASVRELHHVVNGEVILK